MRSLMPLPQPCGGWSWPPNSGRNWGGATLFGPGGPPGPGSCRRGRHACRCQHPGRTTGLPDSGRPGSAAHRRRPPMVQCPRPGTGRRLSGDRGCHRTRPVADASPAPVARCGSTNNHGGPPWQPLAGRMRPKPQPWPSPPCPCTRYAPTATQSPERIARNRSYPDRPRPASP